MKKNSNNQQREKINETTIKSDYKPQFLQISIKNESNQKSSRCFMFKLIKRLIF